MIVASFGNDEDRLIAANQSTINPNSHNQRLSQLLLNLAVRQHRARQFKLIRIVNIDAVTRLHDVKGSGRIIKSSVIFQETSRNNISSAIDEIIWREQLPASGAGGRRHCPQKLTVMLSHHLAGML